MIIRKVLFGVVIVLLFQSVSFAQSKATVGGWYMHSCYRNGQDLVEMDKILYYAAKNIVVMIDLRDNSLQVLDKKAGLSDVGICCLGSSPSIKMLVICYDNSNVDLYDGRTIFNVPDICNKQIAGNKAINKVFCDAQYAYLATGIGIIVVDLKKKVVKDTWFFKKENQTYEVNDMIIVDSTVYAATDDGIFYTKRNNTFINNFATWGKITNVNSYNNSLFKQFALMNNTIYVFKNDTVEIIDTNVTYKIKDVIYVKNGNLWEKANIEIEDGSPYFVCKFIQASSNKFFVGTNGELQRYQWNPIGNRFEREKIYFWCNAPKAAFYAFDGKTYLADENGLHWGGTEDWVHTILIPGPAQESAMAMDWKKSKLAVVHNTTEDWVPTWRRAHLSTLRGEDWTITDENKQLDPRDFIDVCIAPYDTSIVYAASYLQGLVEVRSDTIYKVYNSTNSALGTEVDGTIRVARMAFDGHNNLWITHWTSSNSVAVLEKNGDWKSFSIPFIGGNEMGSILADSRNWIWIVYDREKKLAIFNPDRSIGTIRNGTWLPLNTSLKEEEGAFTYIYTLTEAKDGSIWMGTDKGIKIYYSPKRLLDELNTIPQSIPVEVIRNGDTLTELVLGSEAVRCIKVDGGNRKWVGTENAGAFLLSPDGETELFHFTKDNSPLPSNSVYSIAIDGETGDVYFGTDKGLVSFRYTATDGKENYDNLKIFPNPVRENFDGYISISGLKDNSEVKITDAFGKLVYRTTSNGGTAVWDGRRFDGKKASTGVYFVFINEESIEGEKRKDKVAGKILFIK